MTRHRLSSPEMDSLFRDTQQSIKELTHRLMATAKASDIPPTDFVATIIPIYLAMTVRIALSMRKQKIRPMTKEFFIKLAGDVWDATVARVNKSDGNKTNSD